MPLLHPSPPQQFPMFMLPPPSTPPLPPPCECGGGFFLPDLLYCPFCSFFCVMSVYLIAGGLYQRFVLGAKGVEQIPNYEFWKDFGNLQAVSTFRFCHFSSFQIPLAGSCWCFHCNAISFFLICVHYFQNMILRHVTQGCPRI